MSDTVHVEPENDLRLHEINDEGLCPCLPIRDCEAPNMVIHNSYDGREVREVVERALDMLGLALTHHEHVWHPQLRQVFEQAHALVKMHAPNCAGYTMQDRDRPFCESGEPQED